MPALKPLTIKLPEHFLNVAREVAEAEDTTLSAWAANAVSEKLLRLAAEAVAESDRTDTEAERDARWAELDAEEAEARRRHGDAA